MKKSFAITAVVVTIGLIWADAALAGRVTARQVNQGQRIDQGIHTGTLTRHETRLLIKEQKQIRRAKQRAWSDGFLTRGEKVMLERKQDRAGLHIGRLKHNGRTR